MKPRQILEQILWFPWTIWCGITFLLAMAIAMPVVAAAILSKNEKWIRAVHFIPPFFARVLLKLWGIRIEIIGSEFIQPDRQLVYVSNHMSYLDAFISAAVIPNFLKYLGKAEVLYYPGLGYILKHLYVPVWREDKDHRRWSMEQMKEKLRTGASFFICPEGTCNTTPELLKTFHSGAYRLAIGHKLPLVPLTFIGAGDLYPRKGLMIKPGKIIVYWHPAIETDGMKEEKDTELLKQRTMSVITADLLRHYPAGKYDV